MVQVFCNARFCVALEDLVAEREGGIYFLLIFLFSESAQLSERPL